MTGMRVPWKIRVACLCPSLPEIESSASPEDASAAEQAYQGPAWRPFCQPS